MHMQDSIENSAESWEDRANRIAASVIGTAETHDAFFDAIQAQGVSFAGKVGFNNFVAQLSNGSGYQIPTVLSWAGMVNSSEEVPDFATLTVEETHERIERVLGNTALIDTLKKMGVSEGTLRSAHRELDMRKDIQKDTQFLSSFPSYCQVGNLELKTKYADQDALAKEFVFRCAQKIMVEKRATFTDLWQ